MQTINQRAEEMLNLSLDWSEHPELGNDQILGSFYRNNMEQVWVVDMSEAGCSLDMGKKLGLVLSRPV